LIDRRDLRPDLMVIRLEPEVRYTFSPGQYCTIGLEGTERPYSIVSSPHEPTLELFVELVPHGTLTPRLWRLRLGDSVSLRPRPKGVFTLQERFPSHLMVATVTGIAPFVSMLRFASTMASCGFASAYCKARAIRTSSHTAPNSNRRRRASPTS
jgi:ferredoxin/flavodoxin---NADP+ reductase